MPSKDDPATGSPPVGCTTCGGGEEEPTAPADDAGASEAPGSSSPLTEGGAADVGNDTGDPVLPHNGMVSYRTVDMVIRGRGLDYVLARRYSSKRSQLPGPMGHGWDHSYNSWIEFAGGTVAGSNDDHYTTVHVWNGNSRRESYVWDGGQSAYVSPNGIFNVLTYKNSRYKVPPAGTGRA